jgi:hypothetical protein
MTRLDHLVMAIISSRYFSFDNERAATRIVEFAMEIEQAIANEELRQMMSPKCVHPAKDRNGKICNACGEIITFCVPHEFAAADNYPNLCQTCVLLEKDDVHRV